MAEKLEIIFDFPGEDGNRHVWLAVDRHNRLYINGDPIVTESKLELSRWVSAAVVIAGGSTAALAVIELGRVLNWRA